MCINYEPFLIVDVGYKNGWNLMKINDGDFCVTMILFL